MVVPSNFQMAIQDFNSARQRAAMESILARMTGRQNTLIPYEEVAEKLKLRIKTERGVKMIPVKSIVGSVGRYTDFSRTFLPLRDDDRERWARVKTVFADMSKASLPPIEVYKVGEVYFVLDGNHRVSIAHQENIEFIEARVIEVQTNVPLTPDMSPDDLIIKSEYAEFLDETDLASLRPNVDLNVTIPGQYDKLRELIAINQCCREQETCTEMSYQEAILSWYDNEYIPFAEAVRDRGLLHWFPKRTVTDLYIWVSEYREALEEELGWTVEPRSAVTALLHKESSRAASQESAPGGWRRAKLMDRYTECLFENILVPLSGDEESWQTLEQALIIAKRECSRLHGLHVVTDKGQLASPEKLAIQAQFELRCKGEGVEGRLAIEFGEITPKICERATLADLVVIKAVHPPGAGLSAFASPFRDIIVNSPRPVLALPGKAARLERALLAYDDSPKAREALFVAAYLAETWKTTLTVFSLVENSRKPSTVQDYARRYLELHEVEAEYIRESGTMENLKQLLLKKEIDLLLLGGYSGSAIKEMTIGSTVNLLLRETSQPILICR